ncbi:hypothetical protein BC834DRAFT_65433 [Gloeopeniophorella convolvens]|nr:hypothetical protein BC834DRAFT_65433 [Gloeopeniophorella convolvens]
MVKIACSQRQQAKFHHQVEWPHAARPISCLGLLFSLKSCLCSIDNSAPRHPSQCGMVASRLRTRSSTSLDTLMDEPWTSLLSTWAPNLKHPCLRLHLRWSDVSRFSSIRLCTVFEIGNYTVHDAYRSRPPASSTRDSMRAEFVKHLQRPHWPMEIIDYVWSQGVEQADMTEPRCTVAAESMLQRLGRRSG